MVTSVLFSPLVAQKCHPSVKFAWLPFVAAWFFTLLGSMASAQNIIDLGTITTVLDAATLERSFSSQDIAASNAATLTDFLADNNCLVLHTGGTGSTANVSIGGYAGACIKVYVDGVLANDPNTGEFDWNAVPLEAIASITIQDTPLLGQEEFAGTIISISTKSFSGRKISFSVQSLSYESNPMDTTFVNFQLQDVVAGTAVKFSLGGVTAANRFFQQGNKIQQDNGYQGANGMMGWNRFVGNHTIGGSHLASYNRLQVPEGSSAAGVQTTFATTHTVFAELVLPVGASRIQFTYDLDSLGYREENESGEIKAATDNQFHHLALQASHKMSPLELGGGSLEPEFSLKGGAILSRFSGGTDSSQAPRRLSLYPSMAVQWQLGPARLQPMAGYLLAWDTRKQSGGGHQLVLHHNMNAALAVSLWEVLSLSAATQNVLPTFNQLYWNLAGLEAAQKENGSDSGRILDHGNPGLTAESGYSLRLRFANRFWNQHGQPALFSRILPFSLSAGFSYYRNKIRWVSGQYEGLSYSTLHTENAGAAYYFEAGLDSANRFALGGNWSLGYRVQLSLTRSFLLDKSYYGNQIMWVPLLLANSAVTAGYKNWQLAVGYDFTSKRYTSNYNTTYYAPIHLVSCRLVWHYSQNLSFTMEGNNLLDQRYLYHDGYWGPSRSYTVKIKATF